ncbi:MAG: hypothetical protein JWQ35_814, partial [Bacteriovoracaceae bacterium]|nr:hypothetical protein [Bacteriovoracaceae bacterium]
KGLFPEKVPNPSGLPEVALKEYVLQYAYYVLMNSYQNILAGNMPYLSWEPFYCAAVGLFMDGFLIIANQSINLKMKMKVQAALAKNNLNSIQIKQLQQKMKMNWRITKFCSLLISGVGTYLGFMAMQPDSTWAIKTAGGLAIIGFLASVSIYNPKINAKLRAIPKHIRSAFESCQTIVSRLAD